MDDEQARAWLSRAFGTGTRWELESTSTDGTLRYVQVGYSEPGIPRRVDTEGQDPSCQPVDR